MIALELIGISHVTGSLCAQRRAYTPLCDVGFALPWAWIQWRTSSTRQAVTPKNSLTGAGKVPAATWRHSVDLETGTKARTCGMRMKPVKDPSEATMSVAPVESKEVG